jgi:hypothetical protein
MTLDEIKTELRRMDPEGFDEKEESTQAQIVMIAALEVGQNIRKLHEFTGVPSPSISKFAHNLRKNGIWKNGKTRADWLDEKDGGTAFILDTLVATGMMRRAA